MECEYCKKVFSSKSSLNYHKNSAKYCLLIQNKKPDIIYTCGHCKKEFTVKDNYDVHVARHTLNPVFQAQERLRLQTEEHAKELEKVRNEYTNKIQERDEKIRKYEEPTKEPEMEEKFPPKKNAKKVSSKTKKEPTTKLIVKVKQSQDTKLTQTQVNPVDKLNIANLTKEDFEYFEDCRITPDKKISIYDAIVAVKGCTPSNARTFLLRILNSGRCTICANLPDDSLEVCTNCANLDNKKTPNDYDMYKFDGVGQKPTPVCTISELLPILSQLPGEEAKILRKEQSEICNLVLEGKEEEIKTIIRTRYPNNGDLVTAMNDTVNPVDKLNIANLREEQFEEDCRITPDKKISVYDAIVKFKKLCGKKCEINTAIKIFERLENNRMTNCHSMDLYQFPKSNGRKGQSIPVCTFSELLPILSQLPGEEAKILIREQAEITTRAIAGDRYLKEFVEGREKTVSEEVKDVLMQGLERKPHTVEDVHKFYDNMRNNPKYRISIDLSKCNNKDILYIGIFRPIQEYLENNINNEILKDRFFCKFGVSGEVIERSGNHLSDDNFIDYTVIKNFTYHNSFGRSSAEGRIKTILKNMNLKINYCGKKEVFVCNEDELDEVYEHMESHNMEMNEYFEEPFTRKFELEKIKIQNQKEIEIQKIQSENRKEIETERILSENGNDLKMKKIQHFTDLFERGKITFEQLMEITK